MRSTSLFLFFIVDAQGRSATYANGQVQWLSTPTPLRFSPDGWRDTEIGFIRSSKYYGINRQFTNAYKFVEDGADIIRALLYNGQGYETKVYLNVNKWDSNNDIYRPYYRGEIDLVKANDDPKTGVTVNLIEGDLLKLLNANDGTEYEIPLPIADPLQVDGVSLETTQQYSQLDIGESQFFLNHVAPVFLFTGEGTPVNVVFNQEQQYENQNNSDAVFYPASENCFLRYQTTAIQTVNINVKGEFAVQVISSNAADSRAVYTLFLVRATDNTFISRTEIASHIFLNQLNSPHIFNFDLDLTLVPGEKIFLVGRAFANAPGDGVNFVMQFGNARFQVFARDRFRSSLVPVISLKALCEALLGKIFGPSFFTLTADFLDQNQDLVLASGDAIRGIENPVIKTTFARFFEAVNKQGYAGFGVSGLNCFFESRQFFYNSSIDTLDIGEVSEMTISLAENELLNTVNVGYRLQDIENLNGRFAFNNTSIFQSPVTKVQKAYDIVSPYLADPYVIESIRANFTERTTTDNKGDNSVYWFCVAPGRQLLQVGISYSGVQGFFFVMAAARFDDFNENEWFTITGSTTGIDGSYLAVRKEIQGPFLFLYVLPNDVTTVVFTDIVDIIFPRQLLRANYSTLEGVPDESFVYNIEKLTPKRMLLKHGAHIRSAMYFFTQERIAFNTADRNQALLTVLNGTRIGEADDVRVEDLAAPLFYPFEFSFKTRVPATFNDIFSAAVNGHIKFQYNGVPLYGFPVQMSVKPGTNEAQDWKLLASPRNDLQALIELIANPFNSVVMATYGLSFSMLNPVQMLPESPTRNPRYHFIHMDAGTYAEQSQRYIGYRPYGQKWQTNDIIHMQCLTRQLGPVRLEVIDANGRIYITEAMATVTTPAVQQPYNLFQGSIELAGLAPGTYWIRCIAGIEGVEITFISEPQCIGEDWPNTLVFKYKNTRNQAATVFTTGYYPEMRIEGFIYDFLPRARTFSYEDEPANAYLLDGTPYRQFRLQVGDSFGLPNYMADKINRILSLDSVLIDGKGFTRDEDAQLDPVNRVQGMPGTWWQINIREAVNLDAITQTDEGGQLQPTAVLVNVDTALFGDLSGQASENPVQIQVLNQ